MPFSIQVEQPALEALESYLRLFPNFITALSFR